MGYYTTYTIKITGPTAEPIDKNELETIVEEMKRVGGYDFEIDGNNEVYLGSAKWYEHDNDMELISRIFGQCVFEITGEGEEGITDVWRQWWKNGELKAEVYLDIKDALKYPYPGELYSN